MYAENQQTRACGLNNQCRQTGNGIAGPLDPREMTQIDSCMNRLATVIDHLNAVTETLGNRLQPVLNHATVGDEASVADAGRPQRCQLGEALDFQSDRVVSITAQLATLLNRLAV